jgi:DNA-binding MarR family transcriptional regulator
MIADTRLESYLKTPVKTLQRQVLEYISRWLNGSTCRDVEVGLSMKHQTASARIKELKDLGRIRVVRDVWDGQSKRNVHLYEAC